jgi:hypothetical protein
MDMVVFQCLGVDDGDVVRDVLDMGVAARRRYDHLSELVAFGLIGRGGQAENDAGERKCRRSRDQ